MILSKKLNQNINKYYRAKENTPASLDVYTHTPGYLIYTAFEYLAFTSMTIIILHESGLIDAGFGDPISLVMTIYQDIFGGKEVSVSNEELDGMYRKLFILLIPAAIFSHIIRKIKKAVFHHREYTALELLSKKYPAEEAEYIVKYGLYKFIKPNIFTGQTTPDIKVTDNADGVFKDNAPKIHSIFLFIFLTITIVIFINVLLK